MLHNFLQHGSHSARGVGANYITNVGEVFFQHLSIVIRHFREIARSDADAVIRKGAIRSGLLEQCNVGCAQRNRQIFRKVGGDTEATSVANHSLDAKLLGQPEGRDIPRLRQSTPQADGAFKLFIVVVGNIGPGGSLKHGGSIQNRVVGPRTAIDGGRINVRLE